MKFFFAFKFPDPLKALLRFEACGTPMHGARMVESEHMVLVSTRPRDTLCRTYAAAAASIVRNARLFLLLFLSWTSFVQAQTESENIQDNYVQQRSEKQ